jgi:hypothetical protein
MKQAELEKLLERIMSRGNPAYNTPSGAFLEYLSDLATKLDLETFADACYRYTVIHPHSSAFIAARVPGILCARYFTVLPDFNYEEFICWSLRTPEWAKELKAGFSSSGRLNSAVASIVTSVKAMPSTKSGK